MMKGLRPLMEEEDEAEEPKCPPIEIYFTVNCPSLHIVPASSFTNDARGHQISEGLWELTSGSFSNGSPKTFCPQCHQFISRTREIPFMYTLPSGQSDLAHSASIRSQRESLFGGNSSVSSVPSPLPSPGTSNRTSRHSEGRPDSFMSNPSSVSTSPPGPPLSPIAATKNGATAGFRPDSPPLPEVVVETEPDTTYISRPTATFIHEGDSSSTVVEAPTPDIYADRQRVLSPAPSSAPSTASRSKFNFFKRPSFGRERSDRSFISVRSKGSGKSVGGIVGLHHDGAEIVSELPDTMSFSVSATGRALLGWSVDSGKLTRIELDKNKARRMDLAKFLPAAQQDLPLRIRRAVEGDGVIAVVLSQNMEYMLLVMHESGKASQGCLRALDPQEPSCLAISSDNYFVAVGVGSRVLLLRYATFTLQWCTPLDVPGFADGGTVKSQTCSFSADSGSLAVSTQRADLRQVHDADTVYTFVWPCQVDAKEPMRLWPCRMPSDTPALSSIQWLPSASLAFITGVTSHPYPLFLPVSTRALPHPLPTINEYRIRATYLSPSPNSHLLYIIDVDDKVSRVDLRARHIHQVADISAYTGRAHSDGAGAVLGATPDGLPRAFWRQGPELWCLDIREDGTSNKRSLNAVYHGATTV